MLLRSPSVQTHKESGLFQNDLNKTERDLNKPNNIMVPKMVT